MVSEKAFQFFVGLAKLEFCAHFLINNQEKKDKYIMIKILKN
jgi:hypothetical protein